MTPIFFSDQKAFRKWLEKNHKKETEVLVGFYKVSTGKPTLTWSESVDQALCFGWIDGVRTSINDESYQIRFTPRKATSNWSAVNIKKISELTKKGLMMPAGIAAFKNRKEKNSEIYSYENEEAVFPPEFEKKFKANKKAWKYFEALAPGYRKTSKSWVMSAKQETTREKRLAMLIEDSEAGTNQWKDNKYMKK
jgi:uncharacterized protein YdeI (YjbR/CyaY-like superfamily)